MTTEKPNSQFNSESSKVHLDPTIAKEYLEMFRRNCEIKAKYELQQLLKQRELNIPSPDEYEPIDEVEFFD